MNIKREKRHTITEAAKKIGVAPKTIVRWEQTGKVIKASRDWRGWRVYSPNEVEQLKSYVDSLYPAL